MSNKNNNFSDEARPFIVLALPRSRTAWLSHWLSYPGKLVGHDISINCNRASDFIDSYKSEMNGTVETSAMLGWRLLKHSLPTLRTVVVQRPVGEVIRSLATKGLPPELISEEILFRRHMLDAISMSKDVLTLNWLDLNDQSFRSMLFESLLGIPFDYEWDAKFASTNIQIDFTARMVQLHSRREAIAKFKKEVVLLQQAIGLKECPIFN